MLNSFVELLKIWAFIALIFGAYLLSYHFDPLM